MFIQGVQTVVPGVVTGGGGAYEDLGGVTGVVTGGGGTCDDLGGVTAEYPGRAATREADATRASKFVKSILDDWYVQKRRSD
jgi:hypothetical protein